MLYNVNEELGCWKDEDGDDIVHVPRDVMDTMRDVDVGDGCSLHTSGIVGWILAAYLRYGLL